MDNQNSNQSLFNLRINENLKTQLRGAAAVAGIAAILALSSSILKVISAFVNKNKTTLEYRYEGFNQAKVTSTTSIAGAVITLIISVLLFYFLNRFSSQTRNGLNGNNPQIVNSGFSGLSGYLVTIGILLIICLAFLLLALVVGVSAGG